MKYHRMSVQRAYQYLKDMRPAISPNLNFMGQLIEFERSLELGNDQHSPQIMSSDPLVATTTSSPDVTTPSKVRQPKQGSVYVVCWVGLNLMGQYFNQQNYLLEARALFLLVHTSGGPQPRVLNLNWGDWRLHTTVVAIRLFPFLCQLLRGGAQ